MRNIKEKQALDRIFKPSSEKRDRKEELENMLIFFKDFLNNFLNFKKFEKLDNNKKEVYNQLKQEGLWAILKYWTDKIKTKYEEIAWEKFDDFSKNEEFFVNLLKIQKEFSSVFCDFIIHQNSSKYVFKSHDEIKNKLKGSRKFKSDNAILNKINRNLTKNTYLAKNWQVLFEKNSFRLNKFTFFI